MRIAHDLAEAVGKTPLIRLKAASEATGCEILGKAEFMNPGQSVKDRAALYIIKDAVARGLLKPGGTIVEGTAGNTGIGLALVGASMGYKTVIVIPETQSQEKKDMIRLAGAQLVEVPAAPYKNPNNYVRYSGRLAEALAKTDPNGVIWANQFDNVANRQAHIETTGPEVWEQTGGKVDGFICAVGYDESGMRYIMHGWDFYQWDREAAQWWGMNVHGLHDRLRRNLVYAYKEGRTITRKRFEEIMQTANLDPEFPQ
jgi:cysteine synthase A